jgi:hypothetical protein
LLCSNIIYGQSRTLRNHTNQRVTRSTRELNPKDGFPQVDSVARIQNTTRHLVHEGVALGPVKCSQFRRSHAAFLAAGAGTRCLRIVDIEESLTHDRVLFGRDQSPLRDLSCDKLPHPFARLKCKFRIRPVSPRPSFDRDDSVADGVGATPYETE